MLPYEMLADLHLSFWQQQLFECEILKKSLHFVQKNIMFHIEEKLFNEILISIINILILKRFLNEPSYSINREGFSSFSFEIGFNSSPFKEQSILLDFKDMLK